MTGRERREQCSGCRMLLTVPAHTRSMLCFACDTVTPVRPPDPVRQAASWVKGLITNVSSTFNSYGGSPGSSNGRYQRNEAAAPQPSYGYGPVARPPTFPAAHGRKRAVLCGVSYRARSYELKGTVNDVQCMRYMLRERFRFPDECIVILTEDERNPLRVPTKQNMLTAMQWLVRDCRPGDSLVFHFSGHGTQHVDINGDEPDGFDEALCPLDYEANGTIRDDMVNDILVRPLIDGVKLHAIIDACHSGTVLDLPYFCRMNRTGSFQWQDHRPRSGVYKGTSGGLAISFSGCNDNQISADTNALSRIVTTGAMTFSFIQALENEPGPSYGRILNAMRSAIRQADTGIRISGPIASLVKRVLNRGLTQEPQLCSSQIFDIYQKPFIL